MKYLTPSECERLIAACKRNRDRLLLTLLWRTGARVSELLDLKPNDIDRHTLTLAIRTLKRRAPMTRHVPVDRSTVDALLAYCSDYGIGPGTRVFPLTRQRVNQIIRVAGIAADLPRDRCHPHALRHAFGVQATLAGVPVAVLKAWLGHADVNNTMIYAEVTAADSRHYYERMVSG